MSNRPILLDNACTRSTIDDKHIFIYDIQSDINVIKTEEGTIPFISLGQASIEAQTETRVQRESDDIEYNTMELMTKTEVLRERDDEQSFFSAELFSKTFVDRERDDEDDFNNYK